MSYLIYLLLYISFIYYLGWTQIAAHGTGCQFSTVDEMILEIQIISPSYGLLKIVPSSTKIPVDGTITLEQLKSMKVDDPLQCKIVVSDELFNMVKVGLGSLGVVTELKLKCIPEFKLQEKTFHMNKNDLISSKIEIQNHLNRLKNERHVRYMWLPYTGSVIGVTSQPTAISSQTSTTSKPIVAVQAKPIDEAETSTTSKSIVAVQAKPIDEADMPTKPLRDLVKRLYFSAANDSNVPHPSLTTIDRLSFTQLRDLLLG